MSEEPMVSVPCAQCHQRFGLPRATERQLRESGETFYCPAGHLLSYKPSKAERLSRLLTKTNAQLTRRAQQRNALRRSNAALRGVITRMRNAATREEAGT